MFFGGFGGYDSPHFRTKSAKQYLKKLSSFNSTHVIKLHDIHILSAYCHFYHQFAQESYVSRTLSWTFSRERYLGVWQQMKVTTIQSKMRNKFNSRRQRRFEPNLPRMKRLIIKSWEQHMNCSRSGCWWYLTICDFEKMHSSAIIKANIDLKLDSCNIKKAGTFWAFSNVGSSSPMEWDIFYLPRP